jgi:hypothetical protein
MRQYIFGAVFGLGTIAAAAASSLTFTATVGGIATGSDLSFLTFDSIALPAAVTLSLDNAQIVIGSASGLYAMPYFSNGNGAFFGESPANGADSTRYLAVEGGGTATFRFNAPQSYLGLLWGSVDTYNALSFYDASGNLITTIDGDRAGADANGNQGAAGTDYVNVFSDVAFTRVVASSSGNAFELDDVAYDPPPPSAIPEPASLTMLGTAILAILSGTRSGSVRSRATAGSTGSAFSVRSLAERPLA